MSLIEQLFAIVDWRLLLPVFVIQFILLAVALIDCIRAERTRGPKWIWISVIVFGQMIGPVLYFVLGKERSS
ncbi:PLDc_N domain-containing protein [Paenibacillus mesophilus]|uniref:PLD nuclease N-terminal domain-containing protein n=1 Tax=Paenibacillus mesophilus TaxID=2582849 RepID=UPI00110E82B0|nr:PLD nuclease N-terminal domain-containing protein [Paenibacillus mesophilus]TMV49324.1 PLDc_N domain-containing protein [Paenibacillus mesophilus]